MNAKKLTEEEFEILVGRLTDADEDAPITIGSSDHKDFVQDVLEDFFNIQRKYLSLIHICRCRRIERCRSRWSPYH